MPGCAVALISSFAAVCVTTSSGASPGFAGRTPARPLTVVPVRTPTLRVPGYTTSGSYPQVTGQAGSEAPNAALRRVLLADQREYALQARKQRVRLPSTNRGVYRTRIDRRYL